MVGERTQNSEFLLSGEGRECSFCREVVDRYVLIPCMHSLCQSCYNAINHPSRKGEWFCSECLESFDPSELSVWYDGLRASDASTYCVQCQSTECWRDDHQHLSAEAFYRRYLFFKDSYIIPVKDYHEMKGYIRDLHLRVMDNQRELSEAILEYGKLQWENPGIEKHILVNHVNLLYKEANDAISCEVKKISLVEQMLGYRLKSLEWIVSECASVKWASLRHMLDVHRKLLSRIKLFSSYPVDLPQVRTFRFENGTLEVASGTPPPTPERLSGEEELSSPTESLLRERRVMRRWSLDMLYNLKFVLDNKWRSRHQSS